MGRAWRPAAWAARRASASGRQPACRSRTSEGGRDAWRSSCLGTPLEARRIRARLRASLACGAARAGPFSGLVAGLTLGRAWCIRTEMVPWLGFGLAAALATISTPPANSRLTNISTLEHFRNSFNAGYGKVRLVLLLSPT